MCMELTVEQAAREVGRSPRFTQLALRSGALPGHRRYGPVTTVDDLALQAWKRSLGRGRTWTPTTREAAIDLLTNGETRLLSPSERSRLRARLRAMNATQIAHASGALGPWARYRGEGIENMERVGPSLVTDEQMGITPGADWMTFIQVDNLDRFELENDVILDADGNLGVVQRASADPRIGRILLDTYLLGDARRSVSAARQLEERARRA